MKKRKGIAAFVVMAIMILMAVSIAGGCVNHLEDEVVIGDFVCQEWTDGIINLKNLSEEGKKKSV